MATEEMEREAFGKEWPRIQRAGHGHGWLGVAWEAWQARAARSAPDVSADERIQRLMAAIEGELGGLFCGVHAAAEILAYVDTGLGPDERAAPQPPASPSVPPDDVTEMELHGRARDLLKLKGWEPGAQISGRDAECLLVEFGMAILRDPPKDRCAYPECGCDHDARCDVSFVRTTEAVSSEAVTVKPLAWSVILTHGGEALSAQGHDCRIYMKDAPHFNRDEWIANKKAAAQAAHEQHVLSFLEPASAQGRDEPVAGWVFEWHDFADIWPRGFVLNRPDGGANPPTKYNGSEVRNVRPLYLGPADGYAKEPAPWSATHQHVKRGTTYRVLGEAEVQVSTGEIGMTLDDGSVAEKGACRVLCEGDHLVVYLAEDGTIWARFPDEFNDGRFRALSGEGGR